MLNVITPTNRLLLAIGNSRLHWAHWQNNTLQETWDTPHLSKAVIGDRLPDDLLPASLKHQKLTQIPLIIASVVTSQTQLWQNYSEIKEITLTDIQLQNLYPTLGIDRALALWGGSKTYGYPCLVIDGGTALTFTGVDSQQQLVGGAILPGLRIQFQTLNRATSALPEITLPDHLPPRWATNTQEAIASGIIYSAIASIQNYIQDWQQRFPDSKVILTGGDGKILAHYLKLQSPQLEIEVDPNLIFHGMNLCLNETNLN